MHKWTRRTSWTSESRLDTTKRGRGEWRPGIGRRKSTLPCRSSSDVSRTNHNGDGPALDCQSLLFAFDYHNETEWRRKHKTDIPGGELQSAATPADLTKGSFRNESGRAGTLLAVLK